MTETIFNLIIVTHMNHILVYTMYRRDWDYPGWKTYKGGINESTLQMTSDARQMRECTLHKALQLRIASDTQKIYCHWLLLNRTLYVMTFLDFLPLLLLLSF